MPQIVPEWRQSGSAQGSHLGSFEGLLKIRVVEVCDIEEDGRCEGTEHQKIIDREPKHIFTFKCNTTKNQMRRSAVDGGGQSPAPGDECPVLWVQVDPDYAWCREIVMKQPLDAWMEQLGDRDADAQVFNMCSAVPRFPLSLVRLSVLETVLALLGVPRRTGVRP